MENLRIYKIVKLGKTGFKLDSLMNPWIKCHSSLLRLEKFRRLRVGDIITELEYVSIPTELLKSFSVVGSSGEMGDLMPPKVLPVSLTSNQRRSLKRDCLLIAFSPESMDSTNLEIKDVRDRKIRLAQKLFDEIEASGFLGVCNE